MRDMEADQGNRLVSGAEDIKLPAYVFSQVMPQIDDLAELKLTLVVLAMLRQKEGDYRYLRREELLADDDLIQGLAVIDPSLKPADSLDLALQKALARGTLLAAELDMGNASSCLYFSNDARGKVLQQQIQSGQWRPATADEIEVLPPRPSLFALYEENIGVLTPMLAETIKEAQATYPREWIEDAMRYAVERNARSWRYISKVLEAWQQEGRSRETSGGHLERHKQYTAGEWKDFIKS